MAENYEALFGAHAIIEALSAKKRKIHSIYTTNPPPKAFSRVKLVLEKLGKKIPVNLVPRESLAKICGNKEHMGIVAWMSPFQYCKTFFSPEKSPQILILDGIQDQRNLGAILRSAHCTNFDGVVITISKSAQISPVVVKASAGLVEHLSIYLANSTSQALKLAKDAGYHPYLAVLDQGTNVLTTEIKKPLCLVIGNEEKGISKELFNSGTKITLPQKNKHISYNASVAAGILMFYLSFNR